VGIIDVREMYGIRAIRKRKRIEVQVELTDWDPSENYERLGLKETKAQILGEEIPMISLPIFPGKNISVIVEVIALNQLLKLYGHHSARQFEKEISAKLKDKKTIFDEYPGPGVE
ncbi:hypothetical protein BVY01_01160, partial [bacterium I07]